MSTLHRRRFIGALGLVPALAVRASRAFAAPSADAAEATAGQPLHRGAAGFDDRRRDLVWQGIKPDRIPAVIAAVRSPGDIVRLVRDAHASDRRISVVSGGHSYIGNGVRDDSILLDLSRLDAVRLDAATRTGSVGPGLRVGAFEAALAAAGLAFPFGHDPHVGLGGYLLGGGLGWNPDSWNGAACFNIEAVDVVLASGETVRADASRRADLLWAARGAGPNFPGIVSAFHVGLFPRPAVIRESLYTYPLAELRPVVGWLERLAARQTPNVELSLTLACQQDGTRAATVSIIYFADTPAAVEALHRTLLDTAPPPGQTAKDELAPRRFADLLDEDKAAKRIRHGVETLWTDDPSRAALVAAEHFAAAPSAESLIYLGYRLPRTLGDDGAYSVIGRAYVFMDAAWSDPAADTENQAWLDKLVQSLAPVTKGFYVNETDWLRRPQNLAKCYSAAALQRLKAVINAYDPERRLILPLRAAG